MQNNQLDSKIDSTNKSNRIMGIDFGSKRIGLAISDDSLSFAFPLSVVSGFGITKDESNTKRRAVLEEILGILNERGIGSVVIGESKDLKGQENLIMNDARWLGDALLSNNIMVAYEPEVFSTVQANKFQGDIKDIDASAAAIILQSYLDRIKFNTIK